MVAEENYAHIHISLFLCFVFVLSTTINIKSINCVKLLHHNQILFKSNDIKIITLKINNSSNSINSNNHTTNTYFRSSINTELKYESNFSNLFKFLNTLYDDNNSNSNNIKTSNIDYEINRISLLIEKTSLKGKEKTIFTVKNSNGEILKSDILCHYTYSIKYKSNLISSNNRKDNLNVISSYCLYLESTKYSNTKYSNFFLCNNDVEEFALLINTLDKSSLKCINQYYLEYEKYNTGIFGNIYDANYDGSNDEEYLPLIPLFIEYNQKNSSLFSHIKYKAIKITEDKIIVIDKYSSDNSSKDTILLNELFFSYYKQTGISLFNKERLSIEEIKSKLIRKLLFNDLIADKNKSVLDDVNCFYFYYRKSDAVSNINDLLYNATNISNKYVMCFTNMRNYELALTIIARNLLLVHFNSHRKNYIIKELDNNYNYIKKIIKIKQKYKNLPVNNLLDDIEAKGNDNKEKEYSFYKEFDKYWHDNNIEKLETIADRLYELNNKLAVYGIITK